MPSPQPHASKLLLRNVALFRGLSEPQLQLLTEVIRRQTYPGGAVILKTGEKTASLYIIVSGQVQVVVSDRRGGEVMLDILRPGDYFGEMGLVDDLPRSATVSARETCEILALSKKEFSICLKENFSLAMAMHHGLAKRLRGANRKIGSLALLDVHGRVARVLLDMAEDIDGRRVVQKLSRQDIAKLIGASREMVSRVLSTLQATGHILIEGSSIVLISRDTDVADRVAADHLLYGRTAMKPASLKNGSRD